MTKKKKKKGQGKTSKIILSILSLLLFLFLVIKWFMFTAEWFPHLHFCNYLMNIVFSFIFLGFTIIFLFLLSKKKKLNKIWLIVYSITIIVGIILMNMVVCDVNGDIISVAGFSTFWFPYKTNISEPIPVPIPPCIDTDDGRDYITYGIILSGADVEDICMGNILRERFCIDELTYTSEDIDCTIFGAEWICEEGECRDGGTPPVPEDKENTLFLCSDGIDNDGDGFVDCLDPDCAEFCECAHGSAVTYPTCGGVCPSGYYCAPYTVESGGWCECVPDGEIPCGSAKTMGDGIFCDGWCREGDYCIHSFDGESCYCNAFPCDDSDDGYYPEIPGCVFWEGGVVCDFCGNQPWIVEMTCSDVGAVYNDIDCSIYGENYICLENINGAYCGVIE